MTSTDDTGFPDLGLGADEAPGPNPETWRVVDGEVYRIDPGSPPDEHHGSNVDFPSYQEIDRELASLPHMSDAALKRYEEARLKLPDLQHKLRLEYAVAVDRNAAKPDAYPGITKVRADRDTRARRLEIDRAEAEVEVASKVMTIFDRRSSNAQSRAKMWVALFEKEMRSR